MPPSRTSAEACLTGWPNAQQFNKSYLTQILINTSAQHATFHLHTDTAYTCTSTVNRTEID